MHEKHIQTKRHWQTQKFHKKKWKLQQISEKQKEKGKEEKKGQTKHYDTKNPPKVQMSLFFKYGDG